MQVHSFKHHHHGRKNFRGQILLPLNNIGADGKVNYDDRRVPKKIGVQQSINLLLKFLINTMK